jgi:hypothetical protein
VKNKRLPKRHVVNTTLPCQKRVEVNRSKVPQNAWQQRRLGACDADHGRSGGIVGQDQRCRSVRPPPETLLAGTNLPVGEIQGDVPLNRPKPADRRGIEVERRRHGIPGRELPSLPRPVEVLDRLLSRYAVARAGCCALILGSGINGERTSLGMAGDACDHIAALPIRPSKDSPGCRATRSVPVRCCKHSMRSSMLHK